MLSFLAGLGGGYIKGTQRRQDDERQAKFDAQNTQLFDARMADINRANTDRQALSDAAAPLKVDTPIDVLKDDEGNDMPKAGAFEVSNKRYATMEEASKQVDAGNSPDGRGARIASAYAATGRPMEAMQMQTAVRQGKAADIQLKAAQASEARDAFNNTAMDTFRNLGTFQGAAKLMTDTGAFGLGGVKFEAEPSADGKTMAFYKTGLDGKRSLFNSVSNDRDGELKIIQSMLKVPADKLVDWHLDAQKRALATEHWDKTFKQSDEHFNTSKKLQEQQIGLSAGHLKLAQADDLRKQTLFDNEAKVPEVVKKAYVSLETSAKAMDAAIYKAQSEGMFRPEDPGSQKLMADRAAVSLKMAHLLQPYMPADKVDAQSLDPLGFNKADKAAAAAPSSPAEKPPAPSTVNPPANAPSMAAVAAMAPGSNFYSKEATEKRVLEAKQRADAQTAKDEAQRAAADEKARADWEKLRQWRLANGVNTPKETLLNTQFLGR